MPITAELIDECFQILKRNPQPIAEIAEAFDRATDHEESEVLYTSKDKILHVLIRNFGKSTNLLNKAILAEFVKKPQNTHYLEEADELGKTIPQIVAGTQRAFGTDLALEIFRNTPNVAAFYCRSSAESSSTSSADREVADVFDVDPSSRQSLLDYLVTEKGHEEDAGRLVIAMLKMGIPLNIANKNLRNVLLEPRSLKQESLVSGYAAVLPAASARRMKKYSLTEILCNYFIDQGDARLFCSLVRTALENDHRRGSSARVSRSGSVASSIGGRRSIDGGGAMEASASVKKILEDVLRMASHNGAINRAFSHDEVKGDESIPAFLLRKFSYLSREGQRAPDMIAKLWEFAQSVDSLRVMTHELFLPAGNKGNFLHYIIRYSNKNLALFDAAMTIINRAPEAERRAIFEARDSEGRTPLFAACDAGWDNAVQALYDKELIEQRDYRGQTPLGEAAERGFIVTCRTIIEAGQGAQKADIESSRASVRPLYRAISAAKEGAARTLLEAGANPNALSEVFGDVEHPNAQETPLCAACRNQNFYMTELLLKFRANFRNEFGEYYGYYQDFKNELSEQDLVTIHRSEVESCIITFAQKVGEMQEGISPESLQQLRAIKLLISERNDPEFAYNAVKNVENYARALPIYQDLEFRIGRIVNYPNREERLQQAQVLRDSILSEEDVNVSKQNLKNLASFYSAYELIDHHESLKISKDLLQSMRRAIAQGDYKNACDFYYSERSAKPALPAAALRSGSEESTVTPNSSPSTLGASGSQKLDSQTLNLSKK